jgi:glycosyltransferase involved in cell wall biosynthesis
LHFLTDAEISSLHPSLRPVATQQATVVRLAAKRSDVLIAPCSAMAERVARLVPSVTRRLTVRMHPVSVNANPATPAEPLILCPIVFEAYKHMPDRLTEWVTAIDQHLDPAVRMIVTASPSEVPTSLTCSRRIELVGRLEHVELCKLWARSRAVYFPTGLESFGFPLAEARVNGQPIIARDTPQNKEIAGAALHGFTLGDLDSLLQATELALTADVTPDPDAFDPKAYFDWMLGFQA